MSEYDAFLAGKRPRAESCGIEVGLEALHPALFPFQRDIVRWALKKGRSAIFADTGLGKGLIALEWARHVHQQTGRDVLILAPLAVSYQMAREACKLDLLPTVCRTARDLSAGINITNYERLHYFQPESFGGLVCDESGILKSYTGTVRRQITDFAASVPLRLACTATPAPNDLIELINHSEYLGVMQAREIIALFFTQNGNSSHDWRLKGYARQEFWRWLASWSVALRSPADLGYPDGDFKLPPLHIRPVTVTCDVLSPGSLFPVEARTLDEIRASMRASLPQRVAAAADLVNGSDETWLCYCYLNDESTALKRAIPDATEVRGSDPPEHKEKALLDFAEGKIRVLVSKPSIAGFGLNFQCCSHVAFVGLSHSWEQYYQAIRRCWRFGQKRPVHCYVITSENEGAVVTAIERKEAQAREMMSEIVTHVQELQSGASSRDETPYQEEETYSEDWALYLGDNVREIDKLATDSIGLAIFSPPFPSMYVYSNQPEDMGNVRSIEEMLTQFQFLLGADKLLRVLMPGRNCCIHLTQIPAFKYLDGYSGLQDFRGSVISGMIRAGWIYYSEVCIDKDPQIKAARTKERGLAFRTLATDAADSRPALADYLLVFKKPGDNLRQIRAGRSRENHNEGAWITAEEWIEWAGPVWYRRSRNYPGGIRETDVLNVVQARETDDERHLCSLQLGVIERAIKLWSNPGEIVFDPFAGIGSSGFVALKLGRRFAGIELKRSYWLSAIQNLRRAEGARTQRSLFSDCEPEAVEEVA